MMMYRGLLNKYYGSWSISEKKNVLADKQNIYTWTFLWHDSL